MTGGDGRGYRRWAYGKATEAEAEANYRARLARYEAWVSKQGYSGYVREIGALNDQAHLGYVAALSEK